MENPIEMDDLEENPLFSETPIYKLVVEQPVKQKHRLVNLDDFPLRIAIANREIAPGPHLPFLTMKIGSEGSVKEHQICMRSFVGTFFSGRTRQAWNPPSWSNRKYIFERCMFHCVVHQSVALLILSTPSGCQLHLVAQTIPGRNLWSANIDVVTITLGTWTFHLHINHNSPINHYLRFHL